MRDKLVQDKILNYELRIQIDSIVEMGFGFHVHTKPVATIVPTIGFLDIAKASGEFSKFSGVSIFCEIITNWLSFIRGSSVYQDSYGTCMQQRWNIGLWDWCNYRGKAQGSNKSECIQKG